MTSLGIAIASKPELQQLFSLFPLPVIDRSGVCFRGGSVRRALSGRRTAGRCAPHRTLPCARRERPAVDGPRGCRGPRSGRAAPLAARVARVPDATPLSRESNDTRPAPRCRTTGSARRTTTRGGPRSPPEAIHKRPLGDANPQILSSEGKGGSSRVRSALRSLFVFVIGFVSEREAPAADPRPSSDRPREEKGKARTKHTWSWFRVVPECVFPTRTVPSFWENSLRYVTDHDDAAKK